MFSLKRRYLFLTAAAAVLVAGCGGGDGGGNGNGGSTNGGPAPATGSGGGDGEIKQYKLSELPKLGDPLPPLDGGRVQLAPPTGWHVLPRSSDYVTGFYKTDRNKLPRIIIDGADEADGPATLTAAELPAFVKKIEAEVNKDLTDNEVLLEPVRPLILGDTPCARYVRAAKIRVLSSAVAAEQMFLVTVLNGRRYTLRLQVAKGELLGARDACYSVAAHLKPAEGAPSGPAAEPEEPAAEANGEES